MCAADTEVQDGAGSEARLFSQLQDTCWPHFTVSEVQELLHSIHRRPQLQLKSIVVVCCGRCLGVYWFSKWTLLTSPHLTALTASFLPACFPCHIGISDVNIDFFVDPDIEFW